MKWKDYKNRFLLEAKIQGKTKAYCDNYLKYAYKLNYAGLPIIYSAEHFCNLVGYNSYYVLAASHKQKLFYRTFDIKKKNGGYRRIDEPLPSLKEIQKWILDEILYSLEFNKYNKAFKKDSSVRDNAIFHRNQAKVLTLDLSNYFGSIKYERVYHFFKKLGYNKEVATLLANLCTLNKVLPQGSPTSPALANLITSKMDDTISKYAISNDIRYTRYADDMTFSGDFNIGKVYSFVNKTVKSFGLKINEKKTRVRKQGQQQEVTGIVVNQKMQVSKTKRKKLRQEIYFIKKYGLESHACKTEKEDIEKYIKNLLGRINFALFINPYDDRLITLKKVLYESIDKYRNPN